MILYYDIDNTLTKPMETGWSPDNGLDSLNELPGKDWIGPPDPERVAELRARHREGHLIVIWSCRTNPDVMETALTTEDLVEKLVEWLVYHSIPYHYIEKAPKPFFTYLIDDRAINPDHPVDMLRLRYARLRRFASHDLECKANDMLEPWQEDDLCTCGLSDLLNEDWKLGLRGSVCGGRNRS